MKFTDKQRNILKKVVKAEEAVAYGNRCLDVSICPKCGSGLTLKYMPFFAGQFLKCDNDKCNFEVLL